MFFLVVINQGSETSDQVTTTIQTTSVSDEADDTDDSEEDDGECPEGFVCLGGASVATAPTITVGENQTFTQNGQSQQGDEDDDETTTTSTVADQEEIAEKSPLNVIITNKDYQAWSVAWVTHTAQTGYIVYGTNPESLSRQVTDDRDGGLGNLEERYTHHVTVTNNSSDLEQDDLTLYFKIVSGGTEFLDNGNPYEYTNAPLTASPSTPNSIGITTQDITGIERSDMVAIGRMKDSGGDISEAVSAPFSELGGVELVLGIARSQSLTTYFPYSAENTLELKIFGPDGYTGYVESVRIGSVSDGVLQVTMSETGYSEQGVFFASTGGSYTIGGGGTANGTTIPSTGIEDSIVFKSVWGAVIFMFGLVTMVIFIPWNYKRLWEKRALTEIEQEW